MSINAFNGVAIDDTTDILGAPRAEVDGIAIVSGGSPPALIAHIGAKNGGSPVTTGDITTTGANLIVLAVGQYGLTVLPPSDSKGNTWTPLTTWHGDGIHPRITLYYCFNPTVGTNHNFTNNDGTGSVCVQAWSNIASSPFDQENGTTAGGGSTTIATGNITPSQANSVVIAAASNYFEGVTAAVDNGFTVSDTEIADGSLAGTVMTYKILTASAATGVTFTFTNSNGLLAAGIADFKY